ncbi:hypothetical protein GTCCBUS3UF5_4180 [Geobacillus thermoleovorans CCB_US3_UF5]|uniref:Uncharacterized protein n=1 Tax=Geobacillus thermoleovorans CCB_US3_UF5 TaxID=1111068 RepID=A0ABM5MDH6_GEOTH|nr:hypothetical protein GTCCBUS3UF5_4180 [Geobacillus thermoleovorans CCB_US3_UF5]GAJ60380.1 hypothetical protein B23_3625 [Geobacillus thermoleovorans B23]
MPKMRNILFFIPWHKHYVWIERFLTLNLTDMDMDESIYV